MSQFIYLLNAMEHAASEGNPGAHGYAEKRKAVLDYVATLEKPRSRKIDRLSCACEVNHDEGTFIEWCACHADMLKALLDIALCRMGEHRGAVTHDKFAPWARQRAAAAIPEDEYAAALDASEKASPLLNFKGR